jgi:hypothetical protein
MKTRDLMRANLWAEKNSSEDFLAAYLWNVNLTLGTFVDIDAVPRDLRTYKHCEVHNALIDLRDQLSAKVLTQIKGQRI